MYLDHVKETNEQLVSTIDLSLDLRPETILAKVAYSTCYSGLLDTLYNHLIISEQQKDRLLLKAGTSEHSLSMYDPEIHPDVGEKAIGGKERLFFWSDELLESIPLEYEGS